MKKPKAYLAWPVKLRGIDKELHVTCKYLGTAEYTVEGIRARLEDIDTSVIIEAWHANVFNNFGHVTYVLIIDRGSARFRSCHIALASLSKSDYKFNPHITLDQETWTLFKDHLKILTPENTIEHIGALTLYVDKIPTETF